MPALKIKHITTISIMVAALGYLGFAGLRAGVVYYVSVDELLTQSDHPASRVRVHGMVSQVPFQDSAPDGETDFELLGKSTSVQVRYRGAVPDGFAPGREVVVEGVLNSQRALDADVLLTKCASKYQGSDSAMQVPK